MNAVNDLDTITNLVTRSQDCVVQLHACLQTELELLTQSQAAELIENSQHKDALMQQLLQLDEQRKALTRSRQISDKESYLHWLDQLDNSGELKLEWQKFSELAKQCQDMNTQNSIIADNMAVASRQALHILSGQQLPDNNTYNEKGIKQESAQLLQNTTA